MMTLSLHLKMGFSDIALRRWGNMIKPQTCSQKSSFWIHLARYSETLVIWIGICLESLYGYDFAVGHSSESFLQKACMLRFSVSVMVRPFGIW